MESLFVTLLCADDVLKGLFAVARTPIYKTMAHALNVTDVVIFKTSKDCRWELAIFERTTPLVAEALLICCSVKGRS